MTAPAPPDDDRVAAGKEARRAVVAVVIVFVVIKHAAWFLPGGVGWIPGTLAAAYQLYVPLLRAGRAGVTDRSLGLRRDRWRADLLWLTVAAAIITPGFVVGFKLVKPWADAFEWKLPADFLTGFVVETMVLAFAEELFFRGYLQQLWTRWDPAGWKRLGLAWRPIVCVSAVFAVVHYIGEWSAPARLLVFFPSLVFGALRAKTGSVWSATLFHAYSNVLARVVYYGYS